MLRVQKRSVSPTTTYEHSAYHMPGNSIVMVPRPYNVEAKQVLFFFRPGAGPDFTKCFGCIHLHFLNTMQYAIFGCTKRCTYVSMPFKVLVPIAKYLAFHKKCHCLFRPYRKNLKSYFQVQWFKRFVQRWKFIPCISPSLHMSYTCATVRAQGGYLLYFFTSQNF